jgi:inosine-uridine nucleoside N-ribohydrolase
LTNLCILLLAYPNLKSKISKIVIMGGALGNGNITPAAEFNIFFDPHALEEVLRLKGDIPFVMIPLEVTHQNTATAEVFSHFQQFLNIPFALACHNMLEQYKIMYYKAYKMAFPPIHDPLTIFYILHPEEFDVNEAFI